MVTAPAAAPHIRLGIDVGGTFTDAVAVEARSRIPIARVKVPTSHDAPEGVAAGILIAIERLLRECAIDPHDVAFIAHSTTQATNALLEGDVAQVGVIGLVGATDWLAKQRMRFAAVCLTPSTSLDPAFAFARAHDPAAIRAAVDGLLAGGADAIAASQAFGVDDPRAEDLAVEYARERGAAATSGHDVGANYGLRARTRTAALNAAMLPNMMRTSRMTARAVADCAIAAPLMVMRSDGGVMDVREIERRPILTMLSGPAAGVAGALLYDNLSDGLFVEVGGTSADCSAIVNGVPQMHPARIGGHPTMLRTLDVRTVGVGGGSMLRVRDGAVAGAGPRSAHIAGCRYACFTSPESFERAPVERIAPLPHDPADYVVLVAPDGTRIAPTLTCAANALGLVPEGAFARGNGMAARAAFARLGRELQADPDALARDMLDAASENLRIVLARLIVDYRLEAAQVTIVGGGGGAGAIVPHVASAMHVPYRLARDAEVIAPIGVALALVRDTVERTIVAPQPEDIARIRREAVDRAVASGAAPDRIEVAIEIDAARNLVRAVASGATALVEDAGAEAASEAECRAAAARALRVAPEALQALELTAGFEGYRAGGGLCVTDRRGVVRLTARNARVAFAPVAEVRSAVEAAVETATRFGDVGRELPALYLLRGARVAAFEGLAGAAPAAELAVEEVSGCDPAERIALVTVPRPA